MDKQEYHTLIRRLKRQAALDKKRPINRNLKAQEAIKKDKNPFPEEDDDKEEKLG